MLATMVGKVEKETFLNTCTTKFAHKAQKINMVVVEGYGVEGGKAHTPSPSLDELFRPRKNHQERGQNLNNDTLEV